jgi:DNA-binding GntR family transcriptional regulator
MTAGNPVTAPLGGDVELVQPRAMVANRLMTGREAMAWTLPEQIAVAVGDRILTEDIAQGSRIGEEALARQFQVSRGPVRDALRILEHVGLVTITSRRGAVASVLRADDVGEVLELRESLLEFAIRGFHRGISGERMAELHRLVAALEAVAADPRLVLLFTDAVDSVMLFLARNCGNSRVGQILTTLSLQSFRYFRRRYARDAESAARRANTLRFYRDLARTYEEGRSVEPMAERLHQLFVDSKRRVAEYMSY